MHVEFKAKMIMETEVFPSISKILFILYNFLLSYIYIFNIIELSMGGIL